METSDRGRIIPPNLDDRRWQDLVDEARALIPKYAPQWTDHNPSDIGVTLIELFAHLVETLIYRLNRVPEKNYIAFLNLLGIKRDPATPARAFLTFRAQPGAPVVVPEGSQAQTAGSETEAPVVFETDEDVTVLPVSMKVALHIGKVILNKYSNISSSFTVPPAEGDTVTIQPGQSSQICLGFDQATTQEIRLLLRLFKPVLVDPVTGPQVSVSWVYSTAAVEPSSWPTIPLVDDQSAGLEKNGVVRFTVPATWGSQTPSSWATVSPSSVADTVADSYFWVAVRMANLAATPVKIGFNWILFNSVSSHNALTIPLPEALGASNGKSFQVFSLAQHPLFERPDTDTPFDHLEVRVGGTAWTAVDDFPSGAGNVYRFDPVAAEVSFGNHDPATSTGNGTVPLAGTTVEATTYRYAAGGTHGNVGPGTVKTLRAPVAGIIGVTNLFRSYGGSDEEPIEETKRRAPEVLRNRYRAVTAEDYEYLAREATTDIALVRCLEPRIHEVDGPGGAWLAGDPWTFAGLVREPGNVFVVVVPHPAPGESRPEPTEELLRETQRYLDRRRDVTARLQVTGPRYLPIKVTTELHVWQRAIDSGLITGPNDVVIDVQQRIEKFLHPATGGVDGKGWQVGQHVYSADLFKAVMPPEALGFLARLELEPQLPPYHFPPLGPGGAWSGTERPFTLPVGTPKAWVRLADYELVCFGAHAFTTVVE